MARRVDSEPFAMPVGNNSGRTSCSERLNLRDDLGTAILASMLPSVRAVVTATQFWYRHVVPCDLELACAHVLVHQETAARAG